MLLQSDKTLPPPGVAPDFVALGKQARKAAVPNQWFPIPASTISVGLEDPEDDDGPDRYFGWYVFSESMLPLLNQITSLETCLGSYHSSDVFQGSLYALKQARLTPKPQSRDNEKPQRIVDVPAFEAQARPLTNEDYARYLYHTGQDAMPASWVSERSSHSAPADRREALVNGDGSYQNGLSPPLTNAYLSGKSIRTVSYLF